MTPFFVADIGNSRIKCGFYDGKTLRPVLIIDDITGLPPLPIEQWSNQFAFAPGELMRCKWLASAVAPNSLERFAAILTRSGFGVETVTTFQQLPIEVNVHSPERVGIDRLLAALAIARHFSRENAAAIISAGTAVTVDLIDAAGTFHGGVIFPGFRLMARALHEHTAQLPEVHDFDSTSVVPAQSTELAIGAGIAAAISGGIDRVVEQYRRQEPTLRTFLTGGDADLLTTLICKPSPIENLVLIGLAIVGKSRQ